MLKSTDMTTRTGHKIFISDAEKKAFDTYTDSIRYGQSEAVTAMVRWFMAQDEVLRLSILGVMPRAYQQELAALAILRAAGQEIHVRDQLLDAAGTVLLQLGAVQAAERIAVGRKQLAEKQQPGHRPR
jgi:hypothetical protein